ncbi:MAG: tetratricopeptide repeat protein [Gammaproteobacteria bacterium]|nr:tetratricopeptide repeat protein [Gammaproteobacteria bacterium]
MREIGDHSGEGGSLNNIGSIYSSLGQYKPALDYYQQALTISQEVGDRSGEGKSLHNIGFIYHSLGQYEPALDYFQQALIIVREIGDRSWEGVNLNNIGGIYSSLGQTKLALDNYQQALTISQEIGDHSGEGVTLNNIGRIHDRLGQYELALDNYQQALTISQEIGNRSSEGVVLHNIGGIYTSLEQYEPALNYHQQALTIRQEIGDRSGEGVTLNGIGGIYARLEQPEAALDYYQQALVISQEIGDRSSEGTALNNIGVVYDNLGQYELALDYYQQAIDIFEAVRTEAGSEQGRAEFIAQYADLYHWTVDLFHQQDQAEEAFSTTERGRARTFLDSMATGQVRLRDDDAAELLVQEQELHAQRLTIRFALTEARAVNPPDPDSVADLEIQLAKAEAAYAAVQDAIAARGAALASLVPGRSKDYVLGVAQVQARLDTQTTLVSYYVLEDKVLAFLITSDNFEIIPLEISPEALETQITAFRDFANLAVAHPESAVTLYHWLIEPLKHHLTKPYLAIIPHSILHYLPFAALTDGERYLIDDYTITTLPSASALPFIQENARSSAISSQRSPVILGNPTTGDFDAIASFPTERDKPSSLPSAEKEANAIAELFGVEPLIGEAATESAVRKQASEANILHLAAHGKFNQDAPLYSLIALAPDDTNDGWLTVGESYGLNLENTDLVVLSACETNLGDLSAGDELVGLTRAFIFAGTPSVIASLWAVEDETTSLLMERFYTHLRDGMGKAAALRQAQLDVREEYPNPYYWSAFVLSGDGGEVEESAPSQRTSNVSTPVNPEEKQSGSERLQPVTLNNPLISSIVLVGLVGLIFTGAIGVLGWRWRRRHLRMSKQKLLQHRLRKLQNERLRLQSTPASPSRARALKYITRELQEIEQQLGKTNKGKREINTP